MAAYSAMKAHLSRNHPNAPDPLPYSPTANSSLTHTLQSFGPAGHDDEGGSAGGLPTQAENVASQLYQDEPEQLALSSDDESSESKSAKTHAALLLLTPKEKHRLTQTSVDFAVHQVQEMAEYTTNYLLKKC